LTPASDKADPLFDGTDAATVLRRFLQATRKLLHAPAGREGGADADPIVAGAALRALVNRGERLAEDLLACSGRQAWEAADVELLPLLASLAAMLRGTLDDRIKVSVDVSKACPPCRTDARALETALQHLAVNARDAMPEGGRLDLMAAPAWFADGSPAVAVVVLDGGHGMTEAVAARALEPFFGTRSDSPIAGLGLTAVAGFARQSGGTVTIETWPGQGTRVTLRLPPALPAA
jgi:signal transduction histidine kinase